MWPRTELLDLIGIQHPFILAPMAGETNPTLVAAVSNAGGLGGLGCAKMSGEELITAAAEIRTLTDKPFNFNFFAHPEATGESKLDESCHQLIHSLYQQQQLGTPPTSTHAKHCAHRSFDDDQLGAVLEIKPRVVSFHFGLPAENKLSALREAGCLIICSATTVDEAEYLEQRGVDAIIAQGWEAGGHRGTFEVCNEDFGIGTMALVPQIVDAVDLPVIATGGIADGRGIAAAFMLGASAVQLGSAFLSCPEATVSESHRAALKSAKDTDTRLTRAFSGRPARAKNNAYMETMAKQQPSLPEFPQMYQVSGALMQSSTEQQDGFAEFLLYGQAAALNREMPAGELVNKLVDEALGLLGNGSR